LSGGRIFIAESAPVFAEPTDKRIVRDKSSPHGNRWCLRAWQARAAGARRTPIYRAPGIFVTRREGPAAGGLRGPRRNKMVRGYKDLGRKADRESARRGDGPP
jgi:hypothetical protein